ncbi:MAG TPA: extracellular solute-binding protein [Anaerolineales bacterium]|nr:extracellular solute-binding protein [Anaerolineales bacterium]
MKNTTRIVLSMLVALSMLLTACGGGEATTQAPEATMEATEPSAATEAPGTTEMPEATTAPVGEGGCPAGVEGQTLEMWSPFTGPDGDEMTALADRFSSENACGITVTHVAQPEYVQKLEAAAAANQLPAMTAVRAINVAQLAARNVLKSFSDEAMAVLGEDIANDFPEDLWNVGIYKDARYSFPLDVHPLVMFYNKELFAAAGIEEPGAEPWTREQFEDALSKLEASGATPLSLGTAFQAAALWQALIRQYGGSLTDEAGTTATYNSEAGVKALEKIKELRDKYTPDVSGAGDPEVNVFKQGNVGMTFHGPWWISDLQKLDFVGFAPLPTIGDQPATWGGSHQIGFTTDDPTTQAAGAVWIKWLSDNSMEWAKAGQVPARQSVRDDPQLAELAAPISRVAESANIVVILPQVAALEPALWDQFGAVIDAYLAGDVTDAKAALDEANAKSQQVMEENVSIFE